MISQTAEYALRAVLYLARHQNGDPVSVETIADDLSMPRNYLSKTLHLLAKRGILTSARGPRGGFELAVPSDELSLFAIIEPFDELEGRSQCLLGRRECSDQAPCAAHHRWQRLAQRVSTFFRETTVEDLIAELSEPSGATAGHASRPG
ncbi:MAG: Rrf2 family transcriptional regulator [Gemmatimonadota bacterium]|jgi:Rrf2 family protein|nr:MAG: Rrf2 family transcriptional regulator [Gemmatimonadota bacterium]